LRTSRSDAAFVLELRQTNLGDTRHIGHSGRARFRRHHQRDQSSPADQGGGREHRREDCVDWTDSEYALTPRAKALTPVLKELQGPLARIFRHAEQEIDPIAIHYSQPSVQVNWLLESTVDGSTWLRRFSSYEASHNRMTQRRQAWVKLLQDAGYTPHFISSEQIEHGGLKNLKALILCNSLALSDKECSAIEQFIGGEDKRALLGSGDLALFDEHGCPRLPSGDFESLRLRTVTNSSNEIHGDQVTWETVASSKEISGSRHSSDLREWLAQRGTGVAPPVILSRLLQGLVQPAIQVPPELAVRTHRYRSGPTRLIAFERNIVWQMGEDLKQHGGNTALERPVSFEAKLSKPAHVYDLRSEKYIGHTDRIPVDLDPWHPSLYALLDRELDSSQSVIAYVSRQQPSAKP
jgi:hypothetical protein